MTTSRNRGRPAGTDYKEDFAALELVADRMTTNSSLRPSTAMWVVCKAKKWRGQSDEAIVARWLRKWKKLGPTLLDAARQRANVCQGLPIAVDNIAFPNAAALAQMEERLRDFQRQMEAMGESTRKAMERFVINLDTPATRNFVEQQKRIAAALEASPVFKKIQRFADQLTRLPPVQIPQVMGRII
jgi:hypothetical protein